MNGNGPDALPQMREFQSQPEQPEQGQRRHYSFLQLRRVIRSRSSVVLGPPQLNLHTFNLETWRDVGQMRVSLCRGKGSYIVLPTSCRLEISFPRCVANEDNNRPSRLPIGIRDRPDGHHETSADEEPKVTTRPPARPRPPGKGSDPHGAAICEAT